MVGNDQHSSSRQPPFRSDATLHNFRQSSHMGVWQIGFIGFGLCIRANSSHELKNLNNLVTKALLHRTQGVSFFILCFRQREGEINAETSRWPLCTWWTLSATPRNWRARWTSNDRSRNQKTATTITTSSKSRTTAWGLRRASRNPWYWPTGPSAVARQLPDALPLGAGT